MEQQGYYKAAIYCRLSLDDGQTGDSTSIQTQKQMLEKYCREQGFIISGVYADDGYSGLNFNRPDFTRLLNDIDDKKVNLVITKDLSRLGRDYIQTGYYTEIYFQNKNVRYIALNDNIDTSKADNDIAPFKNILNDMYARDLSRKVKSAKRQQMINGHSISGQKPYGYKRSPIDNHKLVIDAEAAEVVKEIFKLAIAGLGVINIAKELTYRRILVPSAYKASKGDKRFTMTSRWKRFTNEYTWNSATVLKIVRDRVYVGDMENGKYEIKNYKTKIRTPVPKGKHIIVENTHEPIVSREDFERVQGLISARHKKPKRNHPNPFKSILFCSECGYRLTLGNDKGRDYYVCQHHYKNPERCSNLHYIKYKDLNEIVFERLKKTCESLKSVDLLGAISKKGISQSKPDKAAAEKAKIEKRLIVLDRLLKKLYEDYALEQLETANYQKLLTDYQAEQKTLNESLIVVEKELNKIDDYAANLQKLKDTTEQFLDFKELFANMLHQLIDRIEVGHREKVNGEIKQEINIVYRFIGTSTI